MAHSPTAERTSQTSIELLHLEALDQEARHARLVTGHYVRQGALHGDCFYLGVCEPLDDTERRIREPPITSMTPSAWQNFYRPWGADTWSELGDYFRFYNDQRPQKAWATGLRPRCSTG